MLMRPAVIEYCILVGLLLASLAAVVGAGGPPVPGRMAEAQPAEAADAYIDFIDVKGYTFLVTWEATLYGGSSWLSWAGSWDRRNSQTHFASMKGSAVLRYSPEQSVSYLSWIASSFEQVYVEKETYYGDYWHPIYKTGSCEYERYSHSVVDPARWTGTPDLRTDLRVYREGNAVYMDDPVYFLTKDQLYTIRHETTEVKWSPDCVLSSRKWDTQGVSYELRYDLRPPRLEADATMSTFKAPPYQETKSVELTHGRMPLTAKWVMTAQRLGDCAKSPAPIRADDPLLNAGNVEVKLHPDAASIAPGDLTLVTASVTCDGVAVEGAQLEVKSEVEEKSGGHLHDDQGHPRPRGCLDQTNITPQNPAIRLQGTTGKDGRTIFLFQPGTNEVCGAERSIAGDYRITAELLDPKSGNPSGKKSRTVGIRVSRPADPNWVKLDEPKGANYIVVRGDKTKHPDGTWGTQATMNAIKALANEFEAAQNKHNTELVSLGLKAWPVVPLSVNDISLKDGGLFDVVGYDVKKQTKKKGSPWSPPHYSHLNGTGVDLNAAYFSYVPITKEKGCKDCIDPAGWYIKTLKSLGEPKFGRWEKGEPTLHLGVNQNWEQRVRAQAAGPDLSVAIFPAQAEVRAAAPGQVVTYTIGLDNLNGDGAASGVVLTATLPSGLTLVATDPAYQRTGPSGQLAWEVGSLGVSALPQVFQLAAQVGPGVTAGTVLTVTAEATTTTAEASRDNNMDEAEGLTVMAPGPDLGVTSDLAQADMTVGEPVTFTVAVTNNGNAVAPSTTLSMTLPLSVTLSSATPAASSSGPGGVSWLLGNLAAGGSTTVTVTVTLDRSLENLVTTDPELQASGVLTYTLGVTSTTPDIDPDDNAEQVVKRVVEGGSDLQAWYSVEGKQAGLLPLGREVTYTVQYANYGNQVAPTATLTVSLGSGLMLVEAQPAPSRTVTSTTFTGGVLGWNAGDLAVGDTGSVAARVQVGSVPEDGSLVVATVSTSGRDIRPANNVYHEVWRAQAPVDLSTSRKTVSSATASPGQALTYTITLTNAGNMNASARLTDTLPISVTYVPGSVTPGAAYISATTAITWTGAVLAGGAAAVSYSASVAASLNQGAVITNTAHIDDGVNPPFETAPATTTVWSESTFPFRAAAPLLLKSWAAGW